MNKAILMGRFTRAPEMRYSDGGTSIAKFNLAVDRRYKQENGPTADFINCIAFGKTAEFIEKYFFKGSKCVVEGRIQTGSYKKEDGTTVYTTDVVVEQVEFAESKTATNNNAQATAPNGNNDFMNIPDEISDDELPFN